MLSAWHPSSSGQYRAHLNSAAEFDKPTPDFTFLVGRSVGMLYSFEPNDEPIYIVPRCFDPKLAKDYCLGLISQQSVGVEASSALLVEFVEISGSVKAFENFDQFSVDLSQVKRIEAPYQVNPEVGAPFTAHGTAVVPERKLGKS